MDYKISFKIKKELYSKVILFRTSYTFIGKYYIYLDEDEKDWIVYLDSKEDSSVKELKRLKGEFLNNLINESFRDLLIDKTKNTKEMIIARALYGADNSIMDKEECTDDYSYIEDNMDNYIEDPLGIAVPWEDKHKEDEKNIEKDGWSFNKF